MRTLFRIALLFAATIALGTPAVVAQSTPAAVPPTKIDAGLGPCSALITVTDASAKPVYNAKVSVRIRSGFMGVKKLDLETFTSAAGQVNFVGMPDATKNPLTFHVSKGEKSAIVIYDPGSRCEASLSALLN